MSGFRGQTLSTSPKPDEIAAKVNPLLRALASPPTVTGAKAGNAALASLITALVQIGLIKDSTT